MGTEEKSLLLAALVWGLFVVASLVGRQAKMSAVVSIGGGFIAACIVAILTSVYFDEGFIGLVALAAVIYFAWTVYEKLSGRQ